jgi:hypothetical protein
MRLDPTARTHLSQHRRCARCGAGLPRQPGGHRPPCAVHCLRTCGTAVLGGLLLDGLWLFCRFWFGAGACVDPQLTMSRWLNRPIIPILLPGPLTPSVASPPPSSRAARTGRGGVPMHHGNHPAQNQPNRIGVGGVSEIEATCPRDMEVI